MRRLILNRLVFAAMFALGFTGVAIAQRTAPEPGNWLTANRDLASTHYSPLTEITTENAMRLRPRCTYDLGEHVQFQDAPIIVNGVMYVATFENTYAIDASTCHLKWRVHRKLPAIPPFGSIRGLGYGNGRVYVASLDGLVRALDASNGHEVWRRQVLAKGSLGYFVAAPLAVGSLLYIGNAGSDVGAIGSMYALDQRTGRVVWHTSLVATGNSAAAHTWPKRPGMHIAGGGTWTSYTFDPVRNLLYVPAGNPGPDFDGDYRAGANLYTNSIVALNGTSGEIVAYRQLVPHDVHDWDVSTPPALVTTRAGIDVAAVAGKNGYMYELNRNLSAVLHRTPITTIYNADAPITRSGTRFCPGTQGGTEFSPAAFSPQTNLLYATSVDWCATIKLAAVTKFAAGKPFVGSENGFGDFDPPNDAKGWLTAVDADTGRVKWRWKAPTPLLAAVVATAGGVVFTGDIKGDFLAFDARTGKELYRHDVGAAIPGGLAAYAVGGKEYVAVVSGYPGPIWHTAKMSDKVVVFGL